MTATTYEAAHTMRGMRPIMSADPYTCPQKPIRAVCVKIVSNSNILAHRREAQDHKLEIGKLPDRVFGLKAHMATFVSL